MHRLALNYLANVPQAPVIFVVVTVGAVLTWYLTSENRWLSQDMVNQISDGANVVEANDVEADVDDDNREGADPSHSKR